MTEINQPMYGVWIYGKGWVKGTDSRAFADYNKEIAQELAKRLGREAVVYYIDDALIDLETRLLAAEKKSKGFLNWFNIMMTLFRRNNGNNSQAIQEE